MRLSRKGIENIRRGLRRSWRDGTHRQLQRQRAPDADTMRKRAMYDARGTVILSAILPDGQRITMQRSLHGRTDQFDLTTSSGCILTGRADLCMKHLLQLSAATTQHELAA